jgi:glycosyltransferase involved in cell wall biosynthesis
MAAALRGLLASPLGQAYRLEVVPTYRDAKPLPRLFVFCRALALLTVWSLRRRGRVVHIHATVRGSAYRKAVCALLARGLRRRVILHVHSGPGDIASFRAGLSRPALGLLRAGVAAADRLVAVSAASAAALHKAGIRAEVEVVPNLVPPVPGFERERSPEGEVHAVYLGGFANPAKGADVLIAALPAALAGDPRLRVTLAGPGEPGAEVAALVAAEPRLEWVGWLGAEAKDQLLRTAEIFVMPSRSEGLPMALMEAMAYGMAIVATGVGGIPEVVRSESEGLLVSAEDPGSLAAALARLSGDAELRRRLGAAARERAERLDDLAVVDTLDRAYRSLA